MIFVSHFMYHAFVRIFSSLTGLQKLAPWLVRILIPFVIVAGNTAGSTSESYVTATTTTATIYTRQSICIAQWLLGEGLVSPIALEATLRFPLILVTPVKFSFTCCKRYYQDDETDHRKLKKKYIYIKLKHSFYHCVWDLQNIAQRKGNFKSFRILIYVIYS